MSSPQSSSPSVSRPGLFRPTGALQVGDAIPRAGSNPGSRTASSSAPRLGSPPRNTEAPATAIPRAANYQARAAALAATRSNATNGSAPAAISRPTPQARAAPFANNRNN